MTNNGSVKSANRVLALIPAFNEAARIGDVIASTMKHVPVLVVDDEPDIISQSREYLTHIGYHVLTASTGEEALERIALEEVDLVILDLNMPGMGGFRCLEEIRKKRPALKVLIASGHSEFDVNLEELMKEASGFLRKPYRLSDLAERAREVLDNDG